MRFSHWRAVLCLIALLGLVSPALAACPNNSEADTLEVEGIGLIRASSIGSDDTGQVLRNACLEYRNWTLTGPEFHVSDNVLEAKTVKIGRAHV